MMDKFIITEFRDNHVKIIAQYDDGMHACAEFFALARREGYEIDNSLSENYEERWGDSPKGPSFISFSHRENKISLIRREST